MTNIAVTILSVGEPQLEACLASVEKQPFSHLIHVRNVHPAGPAHNLILDDLGKIDCEWYLMLAGDMVLYDDAYEMISDRVARAEENVGAYSYGLWDPFIEQNVCCATLYRTEAYGGIRWGNTLKNDREIVTVAKRWGWKRKVLCSRKPFTGGVRGWTLGEGEVLGTHFDNPNELQVFGRFMAVGAKIRDDLRMAGSFRSMLVRLADKHKDELHKLAVGAFDYGIQHPYDTSRDIERDRRAYATFLSAS